MASDAGRVIPLPKGAWDASTNYETLDIVSYNNQSWMAKLNSIGITPVEGSFWTVYGSAVGKATTEALGVVKIPEDGTITIDEDGTIHAAPQIDVDDELSETSENPVQNKIITGALESLSETKADKTEVENKADNLEYNEDTSTLLLKSGSKLLSSVHIEGGGIASVIHIDTHEEEWKANELVTVEIEDDTQTYSGHFDANGDYFHKVSTIGLHTVRVIDTDGQVYSSTVNVEVIGGVYYKFIDKTLPYMEWLVSGGLSKDAFGSLDEILADEVTVRRLMTIHASVDYMIEWIGKDADVYAKFLASTNALKWIGLRDYAYDHMPSEFISAWLASDNWELALKDHVPTMTANNAPYGSAFTNSSFASPTYDAFRAFANTNGYWSTANGKGNNSYAGYMFTNPIRIFKVRVDRKGCGGTNTIKIQASNDNSNWIDVSEQKVVAGDASSPIVDFEINNSNYFIYYRVYVISASEGYGNARIQFYGRSQVDYSEREFAEGSTMKYLYDHGLELVPIEKTINANGYTGPSGYTLVDTAQKNTDNIVCTTTDLNQICGVSGYLSDANANILSANVDGLVYTGTEYGGMNFSNTKATFSNHAQTSIPMPTELPLHLDISSFGVGYATVWANNKRAIKIYEIWAE